jgi:hypothetical protein
MDDREVASTGCERSVKIPFTKASRSRVRAAVERVRYREEGEENAARRRRRLVPAQSPPKIELLVSP